MYKQLIVLFLFSLLLGNCKNDPTSDLVELDLMSTGVPIKILAPEDSKVVVDDLGFMKDITIKKDDAFFIQILAGDALTNDRSKIIADQKQTVEEGPFFSQILIEDEAGFIFEKKIDETKINHDFRLVKIQGNQEYIFQTGLIGTFSLEDVKKMYAAVK